MGLVNDFQTPSKFYKSEDIPLSGEAVMTIKAVGSTVFKATEKEPERTQPTLEFNETDKILGLNKTNREKLAEMFGHTTPQGYLDVDAAELIGKQIALYKQKTDFQGTKVDSVRIRGVRPAKELPAMPGGLDWSSPEKALNYLKQLPKLNAQIAVAVKENWQAICKAQGITMTGFGSLQEAVDYARKHLEILVPAEGVPF